MLLDFGRLFHALNRYQLHSWLNLLATHSQYQYDEEYCPFFPLLHAGYPMLTIYHDVELLFAQLFFRFQSIYDY